MLALLALVPVAAAVQPIDCRFEAACVEAGMCMELDRRARLRPGTDGGTVLEMDGSSLAGTLGGFGAITLFDGQDEGLRLLLGIGADGSARLMAMEADPLRVATYFGRCKEA